MGISREGRTIRDRIRRTTMVGPGDILLLLVPEETQTHVTEWLGGIPLAGREQTGVPPQKTAIAVGLFALAVLVASFEILPLQVALGFVVVGYVLTRVLPLDELYTNVDWPVVVLLGSMIPLGLALDTTGGAALIADALEPDRIDAGLGGAGADHGDHHDPVRHPQQQRHHHPCRPGGAAAGRADGGQSRPLPDGRWRWLAHPAPSSPRSGTRTTRCHPRGPGGYRFSDYWRMGPAAGDH
jgi:hypothetical protein